MDGNEEGILWNESEEDENVSSECKEDVVTESGASATDW
jgi:hypothetical protein